LTGNCDYAYALGREWLLADLSVHPARVLQHRSPVTAYGTPQPLAHDVARGLCSPADDKRRQGQRRTVQAGDAPALIEAIASPIPTWLTRLVARQELEPVRAVLFLPFPVPVSGPCHHFIDLLADPLLVGSIRIAGLSQIPSIGHLLVTRGGGSFVKPM
jgi:hypothetical protein